MLKGEEEKFFEEDAFCLRIMGSLWWDR